MRRPALVASAVALTALLSGCGTMLVAEEPGAPATASADPALVARREQAGIPDCPVTPADADQIPGGLPDVLLPCLGSGRLVNLAALRGPLVINVWAAWCGPCRVEAPHLRSFAERAGDRVAVLGLDFDDPRPDLAIDFAAASGWPYPHAVDARRQTSGALRLQGIPVTLFVDAQGRVVGRTVGMVSSTEALVRDTEQYLGVRL